MNISKQFFFSIVFPAFIFMTSWVYASEVNIYSTRQEYLLKPFLELFEENTGVQVNVVYMKKGLLERLKAEGKRSPADMILTVDIANLSKITEANLLKPFRSKIIKANIPARYRDPKDRWTGLSARARILYYSKKRVPTDSLSTYEALAEPKFKGKLCMRSGLHNYSIALISSMVAHHGRAKTLMWAKKIRENLAFSPRGNDRAQVKAIAEGACDISIGNTYYMGKMLENPAQREWAASVSIFYPNQNDRGTHVNITGAGLTKSVKNVKNATRLIEFLTKATAQRMYAQLNHEFPLKKGVPLSVIVQTFGTGQTGIQKGQFKKDNIRLTDVAAYRAEAIQIVQQAGLE